MRVQRGASARTLSIDRFAEHLEPNRAPWRVVVGDRRVESPPRGTRRRRWVRFDLVWRPPHLRHPDSRPPCTDCPGGGVFLTSHARDLRLSGAIAPSWSARQAGRDTRSYVWRAFRVWRGGGWRIRRGFRSGQRIANRAWQPSDGVDRRVAETLDRRTRVPLRPPLHLQRYSDATGAPPSRWSPIWCAARAEPALRRTGRLADGWIPWAITLRRYRASLETIAHAYHEAGRKSDRFTTGHLLYARLDKDRETALDVSCTVLHRRFNMDFRSAAEKFCALGSADDIAGAIASFYEAGARHVLVDLIGPEEERHERVQAFAEEVMPKITHLRKPPARNDRERQG